MAGPGRPKKVIGIEGTEEIKREGNLNIMVKNVQMHAGLDLIGSKTSISNKNADLYELDHGILAVSRKEGRKVVIPYTNIRGYELV